MARFDIHQVEGVAGYLLDCQADLLDHFTTRAVVPLIPATQTPPAMARLHPTFEIEGGAFVMATHLIGSVPTRELGETVASLADHDGEILAALDMLISGF